MPKNSAIQSVQCGLWLKQVGMIEMISGAIKAFNVAIGVDLFKNCAC